MSGLLYHKLRNILTFDLNLFVYWTGRNAERAFRKCFGVRIEFYLDGSQVYEFGNDIELRLLWGFIVWLGWRFGINS